MRSVLLVLLVTLAAALAATPQPPNWPAFRSTIDMVVAIGSSMPAVAPNATMLYDASLPATALYERQTLGWSQCCSRRFPNRGSGAAARSQPQRRGRLGGLRTA